MIRKAEHPGRKWTREDNEVLRCHPWNDTEGAAKAMGVSPAWLKCHKERLVPNARVADETYESLMRDPAFLRTIERARASAQRLLDRVNLKLKKDKSRALY